MSAATMLGDMKTVKIFDCSNSVYRPPHRAASYGPKENDVMAMLKRHCAQFGCQYVQTPSDADVIITNDVFPPDILSLGKPMVKRMDGIFWDSERDRNATLNLAAQQAQHVIFISEYSKQSYEQLLHPTLNGTVLKKVSVILNEVCDTTFFIANNLGPKRFVWTAAASNWERPEKRFKDIMRFATILGGRGLVRLIGHCSFPVPDNVIKHGYLSEAEICDILQNSAAFVNLSYRDAAPKVVCQAVSCGLPVLYADSGGTGELVFAGVPIKDNQKISFDDDVPDLNEDEMKKSLYRFYRDFLVNDMAEHARTYKSRFTSMLDSYFSVIKNTA